VLTHSSCAVAPRAGVLLRPRACGLLLCGLLRPRVCTHVWVCCCTHVHVDCCAHVRVYPRVGVLLRPRTWGLLRGDCCSHICVYCMIAHASSQLVTSVDLASPSLWRSNQPLTRSQREHNGTTWDANLTQTNHNGPFDADAPLHTHRRRILMQAFLVVSQDFNSAELDRALEEVDFVVMLRLFLPAAIQLNPAQFPGTDPRDCLARKTNGKWFTPREVGGGGGARFVIFSPSVAVGPLVRTLPRCASRTPLPLANPVAISELSGILSSRWPCHRLLVPSRPAPL
jgi:hypothetical protein